MAIAEHAAGSQTATITTEHTLNTTTPETTDGVFQFTVDLAAMVAGDTTEIRLKEKAGSGTTQRTIWASTHVGAQSADGALWVSPAVVLLHGWDFTLKQTAGTGRAYPWSIRKIT
jgi:hypothetical protein